MNRPTLLDRRHFLKSGMRGVLLTGLGALAVAGEAKRRRLENDPNCVHIWTCGDCVEFGACAKPKAEDFRQARRTSDQTSAVVAGNAG